MPRGGWLSSTLPPAHAGVCRDELLGKRVHAIIHHSHEDGSNYRWKTVPCMLLHQGYRKPYSGWGALAQQTAAISTLIYKHAIIKDGKILGAVVTFRDITSASWLKRSWRKWKQIPPAGHMSMTSFSFWIWIWLYLYQPFRQRPEGIWAGRVDGNYQPRRLDSRLLDLAVRTLAEAMELEKSDHRSFPHPGHFNWKWSEKTGPLCGRR